MDLISDILPEIPENSKFCWNCGEYKSFVEFNKNGSTKDGLHNRCKLCRSDIRKQDRVKLNQQHRNWRENNRDFYKNGQLMRTYGITLEQYHLMVKSQKGKCAICKGMLDLGKKTHVDHDHKTDKVRGLLCNSCNGGLSVYEKHTEAVEEYLEKYSSVERNYKNYIPSHAFLY